MQDHEEVVVSGIPVGCSTMAPKYTRPDSPLPRTGGRSSFTANKGEYNETNFSGSIL